MKQRRFAFLLDPLTDLDLPWDTSLCLIRELNRLGHAVYFFTANRLASRGNEILACGGLIQPTGEKRYSISPAKNWNLAEFDAVFIRKDPPFNGSYLALTYLLEPLAKKTRVINHPRGIRDANEKIFGLRFAKWSPPTLVTSSVEKILSFQEELGSDLVIKPLYEKGGKGVFLLKQKISAARALLQKATLREKKIVIAQKFLPLARTRGDKRILLWKNEVLGVFERIPPPGDFRSNLSLGGKFVRCSLTAREKSLTRDLARELIREGLFWVGLDVRNEHLIEVNVTSPAGLVELDQLYGGATKILAERVLRLSVS